MQGCGHSRPGVSGGNRPRSLGTPWQHGEPSAVTPFPRPKPKAVVVEDDLTVAGMVAYFLELQGIACFHAGTAEEGWRMILGMSPAMAIIDQRLPGRDGS